MSNDETPAEQPKLPERKAIHRDDMPNELLAEIEAHVAKHYPGKKLVFLADQPEASVPPDVLEHMAIMDEHWSHCFANGLCVDCGAKIPCVWPPPEDENTEWSLPAGWQLLFDGIGPEDPNEEDDSMPVALICPKCDAAVQNGSVIDTGVEFFQNFDYGDNPEGDDFVA